MHQTGLLSDLKRVSLLSSMLVSNTYTMLCSSSVFQQNVKGFLGELKKKYANIEEYRNGKLAISENIVCEFLLI